MQVEHIERIILKWMQPKNMTPKAVHENQVVSDIHMLKLSKAWRRKYPFNVYHLNEKALMIQYWFFRTKLK